MDEVGEAFCKVMCILSDNSDMSSCEKAWDKQQSKEITVETMNEYLDETYGSGIAHKAKAVIMAIIETSGSANE